MFRTSFRRTRRSRILRVTLLVIFLLCTIDLISLLSSYLGQRQLQLQLPPRPKAELLQDKKERIYIASIHWNNEAVLRSKWIEAVVNTVQVLGPENVYVSIYESGSWDDSKGALRGLNTTLEQLDVRRSIVLDERTHLDEISRGPASLSLSESGWIDTPRGKRELRRIPYLSRLRNRSLEPLVELALQGRRFDRILFLNDVVFTTEDVLQLLATRDGSYAAACSLDFSKPPEYYDTFALRDYGGYETVTATFPYFRSTASRDAIISGRPVPVRSCWNGIVAFDASPFYAPNNPLRFRGIPDSLAQHHLEASECCLIHADNPLSASRGVWLNPHVRVGYTPAAYDAVHHPNRPHPRPQGQGHDQSPSQSPGGALWPSFGTRVKGIWWSRIRQWISPAFLKTWKVEKRLRRWAEERDDGGDGRGSDPGARYEPGVFCLTNEMQVLIPNGWAHV